MNKDLLTTARWHLLSSRALPWSQDVTDELIMLLGEKLGYAAPGTPATPIAPLPPISSTAKIAICMGHARQTDEGNVGAGGVSEEDFNFHIVHTLAALLQQRGIRAEAITFYPGHGYTDAMTWLARHLQANQFTAAVELHFNAANKTASGHEVLHWEHSTRGVTLAREIDGELTRAFPIHPDRGLKSKSYQDRGALFLSLTHCPAAIVEPFFGDNPKEWDFFSRPEVVEVYIHALTAAIERFILTLEDAS